MIIDFTKVEKGILNDNVPVNTFKCIDKHMEDYIQNGEALDDQRRMIGRTWCWVLNKEILLGFITLATYSVDRKDMPDGKKGKFPYATIPSLLVGQLAANKEYQGNDLGKKMLQFAATTAVELSKTIGCRLIALHPATAAIPWYQKNTEFKILSRNGGQNNIMYFNLLDKSKWK